MNHRKLTFLGALLVATLAMAGPVQGKRKAPAKLAPVLFGDSAFVPSSQTCGKVLQMNQKSGEVVREIRFYRVLYRPFRERDAQDIWFTDFFRQGDEIWARDEKGRIYKMLLKTLKPRRIDYTTEKQFENLKNSAKP